MKGDHLVRAFHNAMATGRIDDAAAILEDCLFSASVIGYTLTHYYDRNSRTEIRPHISGAILERVQSY